MHELHWSPSELIEMIEAPRKLRSLFFGLIDHKLEVLAKQAADAKKK
ncbi:hypothetical protein [Terribacillus saccharophilus]|jgi:hypothetical protein